MKSLLALNALGGDCLEDFDRLRENARLKEMLGHDMPSAEGARKFLYQFHDDQLVEQAQVELPAGPVSISPMKVSRCAFGQVNRELVLEIGKRCPDQRIARPSTISTIARDACGIAPRCTSDTIQKEWATAPGSGRASRKGGT